MTCQLTLGLRRLEVTPATLLPGPLRRFIEGTIHDLWHSKPRGKAPVFARPEPESRPVRSCKLKKINYKGSGTVDALLWEEVRLKLQCC